MKFSAFNVTQRIENLKKSYQTLTVPKTKGPYNFKCYRKYRSGDRLMTLGYLRGYAKHINAQTTRLRTSYAEAEELYESKPLILDDELFLGHLYLPEEYSEEETAEYNALADSFAMSSHTFLMRAPRKDHIALDLEKLLRLGINGLRAEINGELEKLDLYAPNAYPELENVRKWEFYQCCLIELDAVSDLAKRYSEAALAMAEGKSEPRRSELVRLGNMLKKVPDEPAESFYEALQSIQFFLSTLFGLYPLGRPDRYLYSYYAKDIEKGILTKPFAQELIDNFCLCISDRVFSRAACGFIVGGRDAEGNLVENDLTYMFLTALDHLKLPDPNGALAVTNDTSDELLAYCAEILSHGTSHPAFYNDDAITSALVKHYGVDPADAVNYIHSTCAEISIIGKSKTYTTSAFINLPKELLELAREESHDSFDGVFSSYVSRIKASIRRRSHIYAMRILEAARIGNEAMRICTLIEPCVERGRSIYEGGEKYMFEQPIFIGFSTAVDSLIAISRLVYEEKLLTLEEFTRVVDSNFEGNEVLRRRIINKLPHYGNDDEFADAMAARLAAELQEVFEKNTVLWDRMMPGTFTYVTHATLGEKEGATFDGRLAGLSFSDGCSPAQGRDVSGPTAMLRSLTSWDQSKFLGGMVVNIKFGKETLSAEKLKSFIGLVKVFVERGGIEMQVNVVDRKTLLDAKRNPEAHSDLLVRIGGYSDYFTHLTPSLQQDVIDRTEY